MSEDLAWVAGLWEGTGGVTLHPQKNSKSATGFYFSCRFSFYEPDSGLDALYTVRDILHSHGITAKVYQVSKGRGGQNRYKCMITKHVDNMIFCDMVGKYIRTEKRVYQHQLAYAALIIISRKEHLKRTGFMKLVALAEEMRKHKTSGIQKQSKYTTEYFEDLWKEPPQTL